MEPPACGEITDKGPITFLAENCRGLTTIDLWDCGKITDEGVAEVKMIMSVVCITAAG